MRLIITLVFFLCIGRMVGQKDILARKYYASGEYEKAARIYEKLFAKNPLSVVYLEYQIESLINANMYDEAIKSIDAALKKGGSVTQLNVYKGRIYYFKGDEERAEKIFREAIDALPANRAIISNTARALKNSTKYDLAIEAYQKGNEILKNADFSYEMAQLYSLTGDKDLMVDNYLNAINRFKHNIPSFCRNLDTKLNDDDIKELQKKLYERIQGEDVNPLHYEVLEWSYLRLKQYSKALRQARSLDRKSNGQGAKVNNMGRIAYNAGDYETARKAYTYILDEYGTTTPYYINANRGLINIQKQIILAHPEKDNKAKVDSLLSKYTTVFNKRGENRETAALMIDYANVLALMDNDIDSAIATLNKVLKLGDVDRFVKANAKIDLADYLLISGDRWESSLLYSQVDKDFKEAEIAERSRYRNAMLSYYNGDFEWAQEQFDVLKRSTSRLISNDAIDMSVFIMDNLGQDSTDVALEYFSKSDLLLFQNKYTEAMEVLDSIDLLFPEHKLKDDIYYRLANIKSSQKKYDEAEVWYKKIIDQYPDEIKTDNAIYELAQLYEGVLKRPEEAKKLYEKLFTEFSLSTLGVYARERFRDMKKENT